MRTAPGPSARLSGWDQRPGSARLTVIQAFVIEAVLSLGLVSTILGTASSAQNVGPLSAIGVGAYIVVAGLWASPVGGASMNPARSLGPVAGCWDGRTGGSRGFLARVRLRPGKMCLSRRIGRDPSTALPRSPAAPFACTSWALPEFRQGHEGWGWSCQVTIGTTDRGHRRSWWSARRSRRAR
ncbi:aquaporin [Actinacidiphila oryziradicis]|uniref:aquaporin n=1 Tax=Actinacidiphila oryziradicis TaxID=2571141 RepID=UPI00389903AD